MSPVSSGVEVKVGWCYDVIAWVGTTLPFLFTCFNIKSCSVLPVLCVYMFHIILTIIDDCFLQGAMFSVTFERNLLTLYRLTCSEKVKECAVPKRLSQIHSLQHLKISNTSN